VLLPDREVVTVSVKKNANTDQVYTAVVEKIKMRKDVAKYFALFEIVEYNFGMFASQPTLSRTDVCFFSERKLRPNEYPHNLYTQNYSTATATCLAIRKWMFSLSKELSLSDDQATTFVFWQVRLGANV
jgi:sorting nexin-27